MISRLLVAGGLNDPSRCTDEVCRRVHDMEPSLPIAPDFLPKYDNPCFTDANNKLSCLPDVHVIAGWHMLEASSLTGFLKSHPMLETRGGGCFDDWADDQGAARWASGWGGPPRSGAKHVLAHCNK